MIELDGEFVELGFVSTGQCNSESGLGEIARRRFTGSMDELSCLSARRKVSTDDAVVGEGIKLLGCWLAPSGLNGSRACRHHKLASNGVK